MRGAVIGGAPARRNNELARTERAHHAAERGREWLFGFDADRCAGNAARRDFGIGEHDQRMKTANGGTGVGRGLQHADLSRASAVHRRLAGAPAKRNANRRDGIVGHGEENDVGGIHHVLRIAALAARDAGYGIARARERERQAAADAALADETQPFSRNRNDPGGRARAAAPAIRATRSRCLPSARRA